MKIILETKILIYLMEFLIFLTIFCDQHEILEKNSLYAKLLHDQPMPTCGMTFEQPTLSEVEVCNHRKVGCVTE